MRAIVVDELMPPEKLTVHEVPEPELRPGTLKVEVKAAGCNFFDILQCQGQYQVKPPLPFIPGAEIGGVVTEVADGVEGFAPGDEIFGSSGLGGFAEVAVCPAGGAFKLPTGMSYAEGAAFPVVYPTSYAGLVDRGELQEGEWLLVHAAAGGVGSSAVQIGKALGARVIATAGGAEKLEVARKLGADHVIDYRNEDFVARVMDITEGHGADVIYDSVGGDILDKSLKCIAWNGRHVVIGFAGGDIPLIKANRILLKNISVTGLHWGAHTQKDPARVPQVYDELFALHAQGHIKPLIYDTYPLEKTAQALIDLGSRKTWGKVIIAP